MKELEWTEPARSRWERFLEAKVRDSQLSEDAAQELKEDLNLHLEEELAAEEAKLVTKERVERAIADLGGEPEVSDVVSVNKPITQWQRLQQGTANSFCIFFGVAMTAIVFLIEFFTGMCGATFFDPLESWWHVLLVASVVVSNGWLLTKKSHTVSLKWRALLSGSSMAVSGFYALLFLPLFPISCFALIALGMGLLSMTPVLNAFATWSISRRHREPTNKVWRKWWRIAKYPCRYFV